MLTKNATLEKSIGSRIKAVRQNKGLTQKEFAESIGIVQGFLSGIERELKSPSDTLLIALCHHYGINDKWLFDGVGDMFRESNGTAEHSNAPHTGHTPLFKQIPAGFPESFGDDDIDGQIVLPNVPEGCCALFASGDYMAPTICDGDLVIFAPAQDFENGDIVLVNNRWGETILRKHRLKDQEVFLVPENPAYTTFSPAPGTRIIGKVLDVWRKVRI